MVDWEGVHVVTKSMGSYRRYARLIGEKLKLWEATGGLHGRLGRNRCWGKIYGKVPDVPTDDGEGADV